MKAIITFVVGALISFNSFSQSAIEGKIDYQKGDKRAAIIELPYSQEIVEGALRESFAKRDVKEERLKGMQVFKGARLTPTDGEMVDLYFKVDKKGKKEDNRSVVYLILGRPNENVGLRMPDDAFRIQDAKSFLGNLNPVVEAHKLEVEIAKQENEISKSEKRLSGLVDDQKALEERMRDLQERIDQNKREQESINAEIARQRTVRDALLSRRITNK
jgi:hypothetical protein